MKISRFIRAAALLLTLVSILSSCTLFLDTLVYDKTVNIFTDKKNGVKYTDAPSCYEPTALGKEYAKWKSAGEDVIFYEVEGMDPHMWLTEEGKTVFYAEDVTLPTLAQMAPHSIYVCVEQELSVAVAEITLAADITAVVTAWETGEAVAYPGTSPDSTFRIKFLSNQYPGIYYSLIYVSYSDGTSYLYSRDSGKCVAAGDIIDAYIIG